MLDSSPLILTGRVKSSQKNQIRTIARDSILKAGASSTWVAMQKSVMDGELEAKLRKRHPKLVQ